LIFFDGVDAFSPSSYHALAMTEEHRSPQTQLTWALVLVGLVVTGVWIWKRIPFSTQDYVIEYAIPAVAVAVLSGVGLWLTIRTLRRRRALSRQREQWVGTFERETSNEKRLELAFTLIELNGYQVHGLERVTPAMATLFMNTLKTAVGDKQHRIRGMAASHLGVLQLPAAIPVLLAALEDDHAYVRASAALGLGRMRASEARQKLMQVMEDDWDQTVRSRAREALERMV
jgi:ABC-type nickel/cobalt efflux system permease component RcnA